MLKLAVAVLAVALAGSASAAGWRSLRVDGTSETSFTESVAAFQKKLTLSRRYAFAQALQDIWLKGLTDAQAATREYTASDYYRQVDGLGYEEVVTLLDPTGETEQLRRKVWYARNSGNAPNTRAYTPPAWSEYRPVTTGRNGEQERGRACQKFCVRGGFHAREFVNRSPYRMAN